MIFVVLPTQDAAANLPVGWDHLASAVHILFAEWQQQPDKSQNLG